MMLIIILMFTTKSVEPTILFQKLSAWSREPSAQHNKNSFTYYPKHYYKLATILPWFQNLMLLSWARLFYWIENKQLYGLAKLLQFC